MFADASVVAEEPKKESDLGVSSILEIRELNDTGDVTVIAAPVLLRLLKRQIQ